MSEVKKHRKPTGSGVQITEKKLTEIATKAANRAYGIKTRGGKSASLEDNSDVKRDDIKRILCEVLYWYDRPLVKTDEECAQRLNEFFSHVMETGEIPTWEKLCVCLGTTRDVVRLWEHGELGVTRSRMIKKAKEIMAAIDANLVSEGKIPQVTYIFRSKNFFGMTDQQEVVLTPNTSAQGQTEDDIRRKYLTDEASEP
ncbi:MAG: hypothetical protein J6Q14_03760 [Oscillospiraceae bacterium]|nr:hypothetical protein [Oscillospiraceae bacterium]